MPGVGKKKYNYSPMGRLSASKESRKTGIPVRQNRSKPMRPLRTQTRPAYDDLGIFEYKLRDKNPVSRSTGRPQPNPQRRRMGKPMRKPVENRGGARRMGTPSMSRIMSGRKKY